MLKIIVITLGLLFITGCAHHKDVRPGADGIHRVVIQTEGDESQKRDAIDQANHFCKQQNKYAAFVEEKQQYSGTMKESDYKNAKVASKVLSTVGGGAYVFGGKRESNAGGVGILAGQAVDAATGKAYTVEMRFKCQ
jgi:hypothetical protein